MSKPALHDLPPRYQAQAIAQLHATPRPRTVSIAVSEPAPATSRKTSSKPADATAWFMAQASNQDDPICLVVSEFKFHESRRWRFDYAWEPYKVALEVEGGIWTGGRHTHPSGFVRDMEKYNAAAVLGWRVLRCTPATLRTTATIKMIAIALSV